jgi:hypothetical protein
MLETYQDHLDRPLLLDQLKLKAAEKINRSLEPVQTKNQLCAKEEPILLAKTPDDVS